MYQKKIIITYLINCERLYELKNIYFNIIKLKQEEGILNKFFITENYTEYTFKKINKTTKILIQLIGAFNYDWPTLYIGKYSKRFSNPYQFFIAPNETIPKIVINGANFFLKVDYVDNDIELHSKIFNSNKDFNITSEKSEIYKLKIRPLFYNENIQYTIHACNFFIYHFFNFIHVTEEKFYFERFFENFGEITINTTFVKKSSDVFDYTLDLTDKIDSSYKYFIIIEKDLKTGFFSYYKIQECQYKKKKSYTILIVSIIISIIVVLVINAIIFIIERRKKDKNELHFEEREMLVK